MTRPGLQSSRPTRSRYLSLLVEDYADEWLWRPAMYYRWSFAPDRYLASTRLAEEIIRIPGVPLGARRRWVAKRQERLFVSGDGVDASNRRHVESSYLNLLDWLEAIFSHRPFMLGERPTIADFGLMGPFWRHFVHDPTPARLMQDRAPAVFEWAARTWNARVSRDGGRPLESGIPGDWGPLLKEIGETHLEALAQNAAAYTAGEEKHDLRVQGHLRRDPDERLPAVVPEAATGTFPGSARGSGRSGPRGSRTERLLGAALADHRVSL